MGFFYKQFYHKINNSAKLQDPIKSQHGLGQQKINKTRLAINIFCSHGHGTEFTAEKKYDILINFKHNECDELSVH